MFEPGISSPIAASVAARGERIVRHTPLDLRQHRFKTGFRGFDPTDVITYLAEVADDYEQVLQHVDLLQQELLRLEGFLNEHRQREDNLRNTLMTAQKLADEIRETAQHEARIIVREAEARSDMLLEKAQSRLDEVEREINEMRLKRRSVENTIEASISSLQHTLEFIRTQERPEREDRILLHRPRPVEPSVPTPIRQADAVAEAPERRAEGEL